MVSPTPSQSTNSWAIKSSKRKSSSSSSEAGVRRFINSLLKSKSKSKSPSQNKRRRLSYDSMASSPSKSQNKRRLSYDSMASAPWREVKNSPSRPGPSTRAECKQQDKPKYLSRPGPPYPANDTGCRGTYAKGNNGKWYKSVPDKNSVYRWTAIPGSPPPVSKSRSRSPVRQSIHHHIKGKSPAVSKSRSPDTKKTFVFERVRIGKSCLFQSISKAATGNKTQVDPMSPGFLIRKVKAAIHDADFEKKFPDPALSMKFFLRGRRKDMKLETPLTTAEKERYTKSYDKDCVTGGEPDVIILAALFRLQIVIFVPTDPDKVSPRDTHVSVVQMAAYGRQGDNIIRLLLHKNHYTLLK